MAYDLVGQKFGRLTVLRMGDRGARKTPQRVWDCECECGGFVTVVGQNLRNGTTKSCGCYQRERASESNTTHGLSRSKTYFVWQQMVRRCTVPGSSGWEEYGAKGVTVDSRWLTFEGFLEDMGLAEPGMSIERRDNDKGYCRENCYWLPRSRQPNNRSVTVWVVHNNERRTLSDWAELTGFSRETLYQRLFVLGWPPEKALTEPKVKKRGKTTGKTVNKKSTARRKVQVAVRNGTLTRPDFCSHPGCERTDVQAHHHNGYDMEHELDVVWLCPAHHPKSTERRVAWQGREMTVREWAGETGIPYAMLRNRLWANGWRASEKTFSPVREKPGRLLTHNGETRNLTEWAKHLGLTVQTLIQRLKKGLPLDQVLSPGRITVAGQPSGPGGEPPKAR